MRGMWKLTLLPQPAITVFGGSRIQRDSPHAQKAQKLAKLLVSKGYSILTGGGPGIMEAANAGAIECLKDCVFPPEKKPTPKTIVSAGITLVRLNKEQVNPYVQDAIVMDHFFARKWLLVRYAVGFVFFPGGFGTLDELFEVVTLIQTHHMKRVPLILIDTHYWEPLMRWIYERALKNNLIEKKDAHLFLVLDSVEEAVEIICRHFPKP